MVNMSKAAGDCTREDDFREMRSMIKSFCWNCRLAACCFGS